MKQVIQLIGDGSERTISVGHRKWNWQLQTRTGVPIGMLEHYGRMDPYNCIHLPALPNGFEYQLFLEEQK